MLPDNEPPAPVHTEYTTHTCVQWVAITVAFCLTPAVGKSAKIGLQRAMGTAAGNELKTT